MQQTIECACCKRLVPANPRLKGNQRYCGCRACQNEKRRLWYRKKMTTNSQYAKRQKECKKCWREKKPNHRYMNQYREIHPDYVQKNRDQQRERSRRLREKQNNLLDSKKFVKIDALDIAHEQSRVYEMKILTPDCSKKFVKIDALLVQLSVYQGHKTSIPVDCKD